MKTGIIVYITGESVGERDLTAEAARLFADADRVEIVARDQGQLDISDAWYQLMIHGMQRVLCQVASFSEAGALTLTGRELRLCG